MAKGLSQADLGDVSNGIITIAQFVFAVWDGLAIPFDSLLMHANGQDDTSVAAAAMTDSAASFPVDGFNTGFKIRNTSDGSSGTITDGTATVITAILSGGANNNWDAGDYYEIIVDGLQTSDRIHYRETSDLGGMVSVTVKGVPSIVGISGTHVFDYYLEDITDGSLSESYTCTVVVS